MFMKPLRTVGILVGVSLLGYLVHQVGLSMIRQSLTWLGWGYVLVLLSPIAWDFVNTIGFQKALGRKAIKISFLRLAEIRIVGETFNALLPSGYIGGEPLKAKYLAADMPLRKATSSVLIAKVAQSVALVIYLLLGLTITRPWADSPLHSRATLVGLCLLALGIGLFTLFIASGSFSAWAAWLHRQTGHPWLKRQEQHLQDLDHSLREFFQHERKQFLKSLFWHSLGWVVSAMEVPLIFYLMGHPITWKQGWFIAAMAQLGSSVAFAIPDGVGFFEGGHYLAATMLGLPPFLGLSVGLIRRVRELFSHAIGLSCFWHLSKDQPKDKPTGVAASVFAKGLVARLGIKPYPLSLTFEVSWRCNLACGYCDRHTPMRNELTRDQIFQALDEFHELGMRITNLDGGEALLHPHVDEMVDWLTYKGITVTMHTNGLLIPRKLETVRKLSSVKISLDGPRQNHDAMRGAGSFDRAVAGAQAAKEAGVDVAFTCTVGSHNAHTVESLIAMAEGWGIPVIFQPAMNSLFLETARDGSRWQLDAQSIQSVFARLEQIKRRSPAIGNAWTSLRHFRTFPKDTKPPCAAGWVMATMDPEGVLFQCGQVNRQDRSNNVARLGAAAAFAKLNRDGCSQCWCARLVEGNYQWGMRVDRMLPPLRALQTVPVRLPERAPEMIPLPILETVHTPQPEPIPVSVDEA